MEFICTECTCPENEENKLLLVVKEGVCHEFYIKEDGSLEHYNSDGTGQEIYLQCPLCGVKYDFENEYLFLEEIFSLKKFCDYSYSKKMTKDDYEFKLRK